ncbi:hypothetical protein [Prescottella agglutinans]|uniref:Uncharacterized protein n=1 Tax=Prescottella agglutinans TaxID=1644129 RepID=A0ABT6M697_9NOCA|nr:hypothetical protein [Prescottella agglutinans]MDH6279790.1 hypothetical protein [Prescottella agglutinans]
MGDAGIDVSVASISAPGVHFGDDVAAVDLARRCNDVLAASGIRWLWISAANGTSRSLGWF